MTVLKTIYQYPRPVLIAIFLLLASAAVQAETAAQLLAKLNEFPHAQQIAFSESEVQDHEVGLGPIRKVGGAWTFKRSERFSGVLIRYTWQIVDGFTSLEVLAELEASIAEQTRAETLFSCDARACGPGVQWANRVFLQRLLYGRDDLQRYRVYSVSDNPFDLLLIYSGARTADRQYLHVELLDVTNE